ncbi:hypothetical protein [Ferrimonas marina]|uniref:Uncharacterized protein n=1 Tax=Ferrimonas marina TaxID=299255 RepID=A0A1M5U7S5_9GAMM|nr:hypothetical protein [Ferrimonas marina]SHH58906.1 hypothetical protein SAMN02745129_2439 [Ferrimonas marina]
MSRRDPEPAWAIYRGDDLVAVQRACSSDDAVERAFRMMRGSKGVNSPDDLRAVLQVQKRPDNTIRAWLKTGAVICVLIFLVEYALGLWG